MSALPRRSLAGAAGLLMAGIGAGQAKAMELNVELLRLVEEFVAHIAAERVVTAAMTLEEARQHNHTSAVRLISGTVSPTSTMAEAIARIPAKTQQGVQAKARALLWFQGGTDAGLPYAAWGDGLFESVLADMTGTPCRFRPVREATDAGGAA